MPDGNISRRKRWQTSSVIDHGKSRNIRKPIHILHIRSVTNTSPSLFSGENGGRETLQVIFPQLSVGWHTVHWKKYGIDIWNAFEIDNRPVSQVLFQCSYTKVDNASNMLKHSTDVDNFQNFLLFGLILIHVHEFWLATWKQVNDTQMIGFVYLKKGTSSVLDEPHYRRNQSCHGARGNMSDA